MLQGTTAWHLLRTSARIAPGETVVVHAAAGGVGCLAVQLAREMGAGRVIATASTAEKRDLACGLGADVALDPGSAAGDPTDLRDAIIGANDGKPVDIVLEMTGGRVFDASLRALAPFGRLVTFGMASRVPPTPVQPGPLIATSRAVVGFWLTHALSLPGGLRPAMESLLDLHAAGRLRAVPGGRYPLEQCSAGARGHRLTTYPRQARPSTWRSRPDHALTCPNDRSVHEETPSALRSTRPSPPCPCAGSPTRH